MDGDMMGGKDVREGFSSFGSQYTVGKNGRGKGGGGNWKRWYSVIVRFLLSWYSDF